MTHSLPDDAEQMITVEAESQQNKSLIYRWGNLIGGILLLLLSIVFIVGGWRLGLGQPTRLAPGAFPFITGLLLTGLAAAIILVEVFQKNPLAETPDWMSVGAIVAALAVFAASVERLGLLPSVFLTVVVASLPDKNLPLWRKAALGVGLALVCWLIFVKGLNLPFKAIVGM